MRPAALATLVHLSAALGCDPEQVQAAGGNTSLKADGVLWVKASGLWLADAERRDVFVPVDLARVLAGIENGEADPVKPAIVAGLNPEGLRPSIETTLHALMPHAVVLHTHSVRTLALAIRADAEAVLERRLEGLAFAFVPYCQPGLSLTRALAEITSGRRVDVVALGNHGLVVGGADVDEAAGLLRAVEARLDTPARPLAVSGDPAPAKGYRAPKHARAHGTAARPDVAAAGVYYPDHIIFLGSGGAALMGGTPTASRLLLHPGRGVLLKDDAGEGADELALCLALVLERLDENAALRRLTDAEQADLLGWDAEKYRQGMSR